jgi:hypothetical protein
MRKSKLELLRERKQAAMQPMKLTLDGLLELMVAPNAPDGKRKLNPTQKQFIYDTRRIVGYMGAAGVAKTSTLCASGMIRALTLPDTTLLVARFDYNDLLLTTAKQIESMLLALPKGTLIDRAKDPPMRWWIKPLVTPEDRDPEPSELVFMGLKENLGSFQFTDAIIDEADEIPGTQLQLVDTRLRKIRKGYTAEEHSDMYTLRFAFNPPDTTHDLYTLCTGKDFQEKKIREPWVSHLYTPRPNENSDNLPTGYHEALAKNLPEDLRKRLVEGQWGAVFPGLPVYRQFSHKLHVKDGLQPYNDSPIIRFWDFGYGHPFCIWAQTDWEGRLLCFRELMGTEIEATAFARLVLTKTKEWFPGAKRFRDFGDPAVTQHKDTGKTLYELAKVGITMFYQKSSIDDGLKLVRQRLELLIDKEPALQFDRIGCPILIRSLQGGYHIDPKTGKPKKDGYYDHPADAYRYGCVNVLGNSGKSTTEDIPASIAYQGE